MEQFLLAMVALLFIQHRLMLFPDPLSLTSTAVGLSEGLLEVEGHWLIPIAPLAGTKVYLYLLSSSRSNVLPVECDLTQLSLRFMFYM